MTKPPPANPKVDLDTPGNLQKDPSDRVTGEEPMTGAQASYLKTLCEETGQPFDETLTKAAASERIDELRERDPRLTQQRGKPRKAASTGKARH